MNEFSGQPRGARQSSRWCWYSAHWWHRRQPPPRISISRRIPILRDKLVAAINAEPITGRIDMSIWHLTEGAITTALLNRFAAGVPIRLIGDRAELFELNAVSKRRVLQARQRGRADSRPRQPDLVSRDHPLEADVFQAPESRRLRLGQLHSLRARSGVVDQLQGRDSSFSDDPAIVNAIKTKFDQIWNDTTIEPESMIPGTALPEGLGRGL